MDFPLVWAEIDLDAISHNVRVLSHMTQPGVRLMAVVKADAYGHGATHVAKAALDAGADFLGVARLHEALELRSAGFTSPILIFGYTPPEMAGDLIAGGISQTVYSMVAAEALSAAAVSAGKPLKVHLKVDTGMGRLGLMPRSTKFADESVTGNRALEEAVAISKLPGIELEGVFTHFATADSPNTSFTRTQFDVFIEFLGSLARQGVTVPLRHAANSAAIINQPDTHLDMVRAGIAMYGLSPFGGDVSVPADLRPAMTLKARVVHVKDVPAGFKVSYGSTFSAPRPTTIATVPIGYADGYNRGLSSRGNMLVRGHRAPIAGRVCMDLTMLDVGHIPGISVGDEVVIFGRQQDACISVDEIAAILDTINYEVVSTLTRRVKRVYRG